MWRRVRYVLILVGLCALATCPAAVRRWRTTERAREAPELLNVLADRIERVWRERARLPQEAAGPTPSVGACCDQGGECAAEAAQWAQGGWAALGFTIDDPHRYAYRYELIEGGRVAIIRAVGDLDCDNTYGTYELRLEPDGDHLTRTPSETNPTE